MTLTFNDALTALEGREDCLTAVKHLRHMAMKDEQDIARVNRKVLAQVLEQNRFMREALERIKISGAEAGTLCNIAGYALNGKIYK